MDNYEVVQQLVQHGNVKVYKLRRTGTLKYFALKVYSADRYKELEKEVRNQVALRSPYVVEYVAWYKRQRSIYKIEEFCAGGSLAEALTQDNRPYPPQCARLFMIPIIIAAQDIHRRGFVHRAICAQNVMMTTDGICKLSHMIYAQPESEPVTERQETFMHFPPEVLEAVVAADSEGGGQQGDVAATATDPASKGALERHKVYWSYKADVWSIGILLYELVYNRFPFVLPYMSQATLYNKILSTKLTLASKNTGEATRQGRESSSTTSNVGNIPNATTKSFSTSNLLNTVGGSDKSSTSNLSNVSNVFSVVDDLLLRLLEPNPDKRISMKDLHIHPFISGCVLYSQLRETRQYVEFQSYMEKKEKRRGAHGSVGKALRSLSSDHHQGSGLLNRGLNRAKGENSGNGNSRPELQGGKLLHTASSFVGQGNSISLSTSHDGDNNIKELFGDDDILEKRGNEDGVPLEKLSLESRRHLYENIMPDLPPYLANHHSQSSSPATAAMAMSVVVSATSLDPPYVLPDLLYSVRELFGPSTIRQDAVMIWQRIQKPPSLAIHHSVFVHGGLIEPWRFRLDSIPIEIDSALRAGSVSVALVTAAANVLSVDAMIAAQHIVYMYNALTDAPGLVNALFLHHTPVEVIDEDTASASVVTLSLTSLINKLLSLLVPSAAPSGALLSPASLLALLFNTCANLYQDTLSVEEMEKTNGGSREGSYSGARKPTERPHPATNISVSLMRQLFSFTKERRKLLVVPQGTSVVSSTVSSTTYSSSPSLSGFIKSKKGDKTLLMLLISLGLYASQIQDALTYWRNNSEKENNTDTNTNTQNQMVQTALSLSDEISLELTEFLNSDTQQYFVVANRMLTLFLFTLNLGNNFRPRLKHMHSLAIHFGRSLLKTKVSFDLSSAIGSEQGSGKNVYQVSLVLLMLYVRAKQAEDLLRRNKASNPGTTDKGEEEEDKRLILEIKKVIMKVLASRFSLHLLAEIVLGCNTGQTPAGNGKDTPNSFLSPTSPNTPTNTALTILLSQEDSHRRLAILNSLLIFVHECPSLVKTSQPAILIKTLLRHSKVWGEVEPDRAQDRRDGDKAPSWQQLAAELTTSKCFILLGLLMRLTTDLLQNSHLFQFPVLHSSGLLQRCPGDSPFPLAVLTFFLAATYDALNSRMLQHVTDRCPREASLEVSILLRRNVGSKALHGFAVLLLSPGVLRALVAETRMTLRETAEAIKACVALAGKNEGGKVAGDTRQKTQQEIPERIRKTLKNILETDEAVAGLVLHKSVRPHGSGFVRHLLTIVRGFLSLHNSLLTRATSKDARTGQSDSLAVLLELCLSSASSAASHLVTCFNTMLRSFIFAPTPQFLSQAVSSKSKAIKILSGFGGLFKGESVTIEEIVKCSSEIKETAGDISDVVAGLARECEEIKKVSKSDGGKNCSSEYYSVFPINAATAIITSALFLAKVNPGYMCSTFPVQLMKYVLSYTKLDVNIGSLAYKSLLSLIQEIIGLFNQMLLRSGEVKDMRGKVIMFCVSVRSIITNNVTSILIKRIIEKTQDIMKEEQEQSIYVDVGGRLDPTLSNEIVTLTNIIKHTIIVCDFIGNSNNSKPNNDQDDKLVIQLSREAKVDLSILLNTFQITTRLIGRSLRLRSALITKGEWEKLAPLPSDIFLFLLEAYTVIGSPSSPSNHELVSTVKLIGKFTNGFAKGLWDLKSSNPQMFEKVFSTAETFLNQLLNLAMKLRFVQLERQTEVSDMSPLTYGSQVCMSLTRRLLEDLSRFRINMKDKRSLELLKTVGTASAEKGKNQFGKLFE